LSGCLSLFENYFEDKELFKQLIHVRECCDKILKEPFLIHFTDHSIKHSDKVLENCYHLLEENLSKSDPSVRVNDFELAILIAACYLHDIGMQYPISEQQELGIPYVTEELSEKVRKNHNEKACELIDNSVSGDSLKRIALGLTEYQILTDLISCIKDVCRHHTTDFKEFDKLDSLYSKEIRIGFLIALFRLADILDITQSRIDIDKLKRFDIPNESKLHWWRCYYVKSVVIKNGLISIKMSTPKMDPIYICCTHTHMSSHTDIGMCLFKLNALTITLSQSVSTLPEYISSGILFVVELTRPLL